MYLLSPHTVVLCCDYILIYAHDKDLNAIIILLLLQLTNCSLGLASCLRLVQEIPYSSVASRSLVDLQKGSTNEITYQDRDGHDRPKR